MPLNYVALAAGGVLGTLCRYWLVLGLLRGTGSDFPWGVFAANLLGSLTIGFLLTACAGPFQNQPAWRLFSVVGFLGSFTTFSTFSMDLLLFIQRGQVGAGILYCLGSVLGGVTLAGAGWYLGGLVKSP